MLLATILSFRRKLISKQNYRIVYATLVKTLLAKIPLALRPPKRSEFRTKIGKWNLYCEWWTHCPNENENKRVRESEVWYFNINVRTIRAVANVLKMASMLCDGQLWLQHDQDAKRKHRQTVAPMNEPSFCGYVVPDSFCGQPP